MHEASGRGATKKLAKQGAGAPPHAPICALLLLHMCLLTVTCVLILLYVSSYCCVLVLL